MDFLFIWILYAYRSTRLPLSFGLVIGILAVMVRAVLYVVTRRKEAAVVMVGVGAGVVLLTLALLVLAAHSGM